MNIFVALDRSGSMMGRPWETAIGSLKEYISGLKSEKIEGRVTITAFDSNQGKTELVTMESSIPYFEALSPEWLQPRGMTPLYDAAASVMDQALAAGGERSVVVILTDGAENASREFTQLGVKAKVEAIVARGWEVIFLGANFDVGGYTAASGLTSGKMRNFDLGNDAQRLKMTGDLRSATVAYAMSGKGIEL